MRLVRSIVLCMLTAIMALLWWELITQGLLIRASMLTAVLCLAFMIAVHDDPRYDTATAMLARMIESLLRRLRATGWHVAGATAHQQSGDIARAAVAGFGVTAEGQLVVGHKLVREVAGIQVQGAPVTAIQPYVVRRCGLCVCGADKRRRHQHAG